jgi:hypothetical protein
MALSLLITLFLLTSIGVFYFFLGALWWKNAYERKQVRRYFGEVVEGVKEGKWSGSYVLGVFLRRVLVVGWVVGMQKSQLEAYLIVIVM